MEYWILDKDHNVIQANDALEWGEFFQDFNNRRVALTYLPDGTRISTVFLGIDHGVGTGTVLLFETMVFHNNSDLESDVERYPTWTKAKEGHKRMVEKWRNNL